MKSIVSSLFLLILFTSPIQAAQNNAGYCQKAQTTADLMECIGTHYKAKTSQMEALYRSLMTETQERPEFQQQLEANQQAWIAYRDDICDLEGKTYEGGSLQRVQQLHCLARVTTDRSGHFERMLSAFNVAEIPVYAFPPRWMNVLINDYPDMFWALGKVFELDTDCDGTDENIVSGRKDGQAYLAIADSQQTGRPVIHMEMMSQDKNSACAVTEPSSIVKIDTGGESCKFSIVMKDQACLPVVVEYDALSKEYNKTEE